MSHSLFSQLVTNASTNPLRPAIVGPNITMSYEEALHSAYSVALWLRARDIGPGKRVAMWLSPETQYVMLIALDAVGATASVINSREQVAKLDELHFDLLVVNQSIEGAFRLRIEVLSPGSINDLLFEESFEWHTWTGDQDYRILFTSGTSGRPKAVALTRQMFQLRIQRARGTWLEIEPLLLLFGLTTGMGQLAMTNALLQCGTYLSPLSAHIIKTFLEAWGVRSVMGSQNQLLGLCSILEGPVESVERVVIAGSFPSDSIFPALAEHFPNGEVFNCYGSTEVGIVLFGAVSRDYCNLGSAVVPNEVHIDSHGFSSEKEGVLVVSSEIVPAGYLGDEVSTAAHFTSKGFVSGDIVRMNEDGEFLYLGRTDNLLNMGGVKINPEDIEEFAESIQPEFEFLLTQNEDKLELLYSGPSDLDALRLLEALKAEVGLKAPENLRRVESIARTSTGKKIRH
jgi:long-chain acyl-CoA synthetase